MLNCKGAKVLFCHVFIVMATLLHFLRLLVATLLAGFFLSLSGLGLLLGSLVILSQSPVAMLFDPVYEPVSRFLMAFGGGDRIEGIVAIALTIGFVVSLLSGFSACKRNQRSTWHLAATEK